MLKVSLYAVCFLLALLTGCTPNEQKDFVAPKLRVSENRRYLEFENGDPFFWLGDTSWGMSEWLTREDVDYYLDNRKAKGFNLVQICLFWGKRTEDPVQFTLNPANAYGFKPFKEIGGKPDPTQPMVKEGENVRAPNDYWDHVDYIIQAAEARDMMVGLLPVWGRRYVNVTYQRPSENIFPKSAMYTYGKFLGARYKVYSNIIWVLGGDVKADEGGDFKGHYRAMAEGILNGITGDIAKWNEASPLWDAALMTYHPDGRPMANSSRWFHQDAWLDFNMIETYTFKDSLYKAVQQDYNLINPIKPTVMGEPAYESEAEPYGYFRGIDLRRQAYQTLFAGAAGFTYGAFRDKDGNGPMFSPFQGWKNLLDLEGAQSMSFVKSFSLQHGWPFWLPIQHVIISGGGKGSLQKLAVFSESANECYVYYPDPTEATLDLSTYFTTANIQVQWYNPKAGFYSDKTETTLTRGQLVLHPPLEWSDAILILSE